MNTKQIAESVGKPEQTVRNWLRSLASKSDVIKSKLDMSSSRYPADYDMAETCQIIEEGMGKAAADVYRTNAVNAELASKSVPASTDSDWRRIRELLRAVDHKALSPAQFQAMIGAPMDHQAVGSTDSISAGNRAALPAPSDPIATDAQAAQVFINIRNLPGSQRAQRAGYAVAKSVARKEAINQEDDRLQQRMFP